MKRSIISLLIICSSLNTVAQKPLSKVTIYTTAKGSATRFASSGPIALIKKSQPVETELAVFVEPGKTFQTMVAIGGAFTDAAAETFHKLPEAQQQELLTAYYSKDKGIGYTFARTNIQSCDFSSDTYSYVGDNDPQLKTFNISHDKKYRMPFIKAAYKAAGGKLDMFVSL